MKRVTTMGASPLTKQTIYARDANGQVMAIYEREFNPSLNNNPQPQIKFKLEFQTGSCTKMIELVVGDYYINDNGITINSNNIPVNVLCGEFLFQYTLQNGTNINFESYADWFSSKVSQIKNINLISVSASIEYINQNMLPKLAEWHVYGNEQQGRFLTKYPEVNPTYYGLDVTDNIKNGIFSRQLGKKAYELKDHLGNVRVTFSDIKMPTGTPVQPFRVDLLSKSEYYPYGMKINDLSYNATGARYGYNGTHEQDKELNADGNYLDFGNFGYDTRVAMRRNQEPLRAKYPHLSGYSAYGSNPIFFKDPDGHWIKGVNGKAVTYKLNEDGCATWSKNATEDAMRVGNAMLRTEHGKNLLDILIKLNYPINLIISQDINNNKFAETNYKFKGKSLKIKSAEIIIFEGKINDAKKIVDSGQYFEGERGLLYTEFLEDGDIEAIIGTNGVHEVSHLEEKNIQENDINIKLLKTNTPAQFDTEKSPIENEIKYLKELKQYIIDNNEKLNETD